MKIKEYFFNSYYYRLRKGCRLYNLLNKGKIIFSDTKDDILQNYSIVKGDKSLLDSDTRKEFIGIRENSFGFEALTNNTEKIKRLFKNNSLIEKATLEDIMVYTVKGV
ncbi:hypothetical protein CcarbDRAFT_5332 [Clostridium carboxidivorans P7]|uniref:Uncharacterized protein n=1 Tax=Clostridium carboxidivorans P7 TaxID=536227 RepID=C6Q2R4_9CLOT|nr:hypothetical protein CcarbDRAFT_5332 [Clostridium carboxidivorans P7]